MCMCTEKLFDEFMKKLWLLIELIQFTPNSVIVSFIWSYVYFREKIDFQERTESVQR